MGKLFICGTPIGNLDDITLRCLETLKNVDFIAAEDTRHTLKLINYFEIKKTLISYHEHNKIEAGKKIISLLKDGNNIALVTDAGMPGISDPGQDLIALCYEEGIEVTTVPGPTALISALVLSGMATRSFVFEGFLPSNKKSRNLVLEKLKEETRTIILYEAPHHLLQTLNLLFEYLGNRNACIVRELTKKYESVKKDNIQNLISFYTENEPKGEIVIIIEGVDNQVLIEEKLDKIKEMSIEEHYNMYLSQGLSNKEALKQVAKDRKTGKREIYSQLNIK